MLLGEILVADRVITAAQLDAALASQVVHGGRLGTNLLEAGVLDLDTLTRALAKKHGVPAALEEHFARIDPAVARALPARAAARHLAIPLAYANAARTQLTVAFADPLSPAALDEVAFALSARVQPWVAPEARLLYNLERLYGIKRPNRFVRIDSVPRVQAPAESHDPRDRRRYVQPHPDPALTPSAPTVVAPDSQRADSVRPSAIAAEETAKSDSQRSESPSVNREEHSRYQESHSEHREERSRYRESHSEHREEHSQHPFPDSGPVTPDSAAPISILPLAESPPPPAPDPRPIALAQIAAATSREEIGTALASYLHAAFGVGLALIAREGVALGWRAASPDLADATVDAIAIPLSAPTLLRAAFEREDAVRGAPPPAGLELHARLAEVLGAATPAHAVVAPVVLRQRVVNLVYAQRSDGGEIDDAAVEALLAVCNAVAEGYTRLLQIARAPREPDANAPKKRGWKRPTRT